ncbi:DUF4399 domain-containing protein [Marinihelvus fidelis]|uniref:DUF4399 domain-containing protein n=1 Tax=Marinihelvus fidelis TaxID=2613842 RepID=A0A5N0T9C0_9GAMM|nr:DUF4399 domain-containing protein [Marinihelvus fidelis]
MRALLFLTMLVLSAPAALAGEARVYFITPADGDVIEGPVTVKFGLKGMGVAPAGTMADNTGHHHLLIDGPDLPPPGVPLPATDQVKHFGGGQTETVLELSPGTHTLQLIVGDHAHIPASPPVASDVITIEVR